MASQSSLTERLNLFMRGDLGVVDSLLQDILPTLHEIAVRELKRERYMAPVSKTELIHEVWLRNLSKGGWQINDQGHFYALASLAMRRVLIEMARKRLAAVDIGLAMDQLEAKDSDAARVVDMHYFSGFTLREIAEKMGLGVRSVRTLWGRGLKELEKVLRSLPDLSE